MTSAPKSSFELLPLLTWAFGKLQQDGLKDVDDGILLAFIERRGGRGGRCRIPMKLQKAHELFERLIIPRKYYLVNLFLSEKLRGAQQSEAPESKPEETQQEPTRAELIQHIRQLSEHLDYCGWGDSWERECSEPLRQRNGQLLKRLDKEEELRGG